MLQGLVMALGIALVSQVAMAQEAVKAPPKDLVLKGDAKCTRCHDESDEPKVLSIGKTKHGTVADGRTPTCTSCHGESGAHLNKTPDGKRPTPDRVFKKTTPAEVQNEACTSCHKGGNRMFWDTSTHKNRGVACASCHDVHNNGHDKVRDKHTQTEVCYTCHKEQRAQMSRPSHHPVPEGKMACSDCHNPHGSAAPKQLKKDSVNETCYECHMEKRGPFVHNHQPVTEDCSICHNPHGTTAQTLLKQRMPLLCQNCHNASSHRTQAMQQLSGRSTSSGAIASMARGCLNCHTNIHGSNSTTSSSTGGRFRQ
ncbi:MAG: DmsE family decaheme c-type cytochrome [Burkholderiales bacterium]|nr:DmsE family decaheme c-type cytochrome [Burkholderiales bacterium]